MWLVLDCETIVPVMVVVPHLNAPLRKTRSRSAIHHDPSTPRELSGRRRSHSITPGSWGIIGCVVLAKKTDSIIHRVDCLIRFANRLCLQYVLVGARAPQIPVSNKNTFLLLID